MSKTYYDSVNKIWSGSKMPTIYNSNVSVGYLILQVLQNSPDVITQVCHDTGMELTCRQMYEKTVNIAKYLQRMDCKPNDIIGFLALNSDHLAPTAFACLTLGLPINCLSPLISESEIILFYSATKPKLIICDADNIEKVVNALRELPFVSQIFTVDRKVDGFQFIGDIADGDEDVGTFIVPQIDSDTLAFIMATSGTSGHPKQVCRSHKDLIEGLTVPWKSKLSSHEIWFSPSGIDWISGIWTLLKGTLHSGKRIITTQKFDPNLTLEIIEKHNVTTTINVTRLLYCVVECKSKPLSSMRVVIVGGVAVPKDLSARAKLLFPNADICPAYGCSEAILLAMNLTNDKLESVGQLNQNVEMKILDDNGHTSGVGEIGEIFYRTPAIFPGYFNDPDRTNEAIKDGWVCSGDLGYFDEDGFLFITDRKTDIIKCRGYISPSELESIIGEVAGVREVCVVGVSLEYLKGEDLVFAFVVKHSNSDVTETFIENYVSERVVYEKRIRGGVHFVDSFPLSNNGKVRRFDIRKWAREKC